MKFVYCLSADSVNSIVSMTRLSAATARHTNPDAVVELVLDQTTLHALQASRSPLLDEVDSTCVLGNLTASETLRSRHLKTSMRSAVTGPFIFVDADTVIRTTLRPAWPPDVDVAAAPNHSRDTLDEQLWPPDAEHMQTMGWPLPRVYLNSGVIFFSDSPIARAIGEKWHECWLCGLAATGRHNDQPSFNHALQSSGATVSVLPHAWNAQINVAPRTAPDAGIWHYYHSATRPADTTFAVEVRRLSHRTPIPPMVVQRLVQAELPWPTNSFIKKTVVNRMLRHGGASPLESAMLADDYVLAAKHAASRAKAWWTRTVRHRAISL